MNDLGISKDSSLQNLKFTPKSPEHSQAIQEKLFSLGYEWVICNIDSIYENELYPYLYTTSKGYIFYGDCESTFQNHTYKDLTETFVPLKLKLDGTTSYLEGVDIPEGAAVAVRYSGRIIFFKEDGEYIQSHNGFGWMTMFNPYKYNLFVFARCWNSGRNKVIWKRNEMKEYLDSEKCYTYVQSEAKRSEDWVEIPEGAEVAVTPLRFKDKIWFFKDNGNTYHDGHQWHECGEHYGHQNPKDKVIWERDKSQSVKPSDVFGSDSIQDRIAQYVIKNNEKVNVTKEQLSKIGIETLKRYAEVKPNDVDSNEYIRIVPCDVEYDTTTSSLRKDLYRELKLTFFQKFLSGINIQYRVGKGVGSDKSQWNNLTWESIKVMKHDIIEFREKTKHVTVDGIVFDTEESLLKYVRKNFDLKGDK